MKAFSLLLALAAALPAAAPNPRELVRQAIQNYQHDHMAALQYSYIVTDDNRQKGVEVSQVTTIGGTPYERLIKVNGEPLGPEKERKEQEKYSRVSSERANQSSGDRAKRVKAYKQEMAFLDEVPNAFTFTMLPQEDVNGRSAYAIECTPDPNYTPKDSRSKIFTGLKAKLWLDTKDVRIVKANAAITKTVSIGWILARIGQGGDISLLQIPVEDGTWLPKSLDIKAQARVMLFATKKFDEQLTYSDYKRLPYEKLPDVARNVASK